MENIDYVLIISIEKYHEDKDFQIVNFALEDAQDFKNAMLGIGCKKENITELLNEKATKTLIKEKLRKLAEKATKDDRIFVYFAGHGFYINGENVIAPVDTIKTSLEKSSISIDTILGYLKTSECNKNIVFLDCCHSGFKPGKNLREINDVFLGDELRYKYKNEEYCVGFASCKSDEKSISHPSLKNGVWTYFLIKALNGEAEEIYKNGILFSGELQEYLKNETSSYVKMNTTKKLDQTPIKFGSETNKFIIADLNPILRLKKEMNNSDIQSLLDVMILSEEFGKVRFLEDFRKTHYVPDYHDQGTDNFVKKAGKKIVKGICDEISNELKRKLKYKRRELEVEQSEGFASIITPDFDYFIEINHSESNYDEYFITNRIENFKNSNIINNNDFNKIFDKKFDTLNFELSKKINIDGIIDFVENIENEQITVEYSPSDNSNCTLTFDSFDNKIHVTEYSIKIKSDVKVNPSSLINSYLKMRQLLLNYPDLKLISN